MGDSLTQQALFDTAEVKDGKSGTLRALDELFALTQQYRRSAQFKNLLDFVSRFRLYAPYNAMLLHVQRPGATYVAPASRWLRDYRRRIKPEAHPLVILQPMGPVMFVFDVSDTVPMDDAPPLPREVEDPFGVAGGDVKSELDWTRRNAVRDGISIHTRKDGAQSAGMIRRVASSERYLRFPVRASGRDSFVEVPVRYQLILNELHSPATQYATLVHELAHLYCGHLGTPNDNWWPDRSNLSHMVEEIEAESVSYLLCRRRGLKSPSNEYLASYLKEDWQMPPISLDTVMKIAGLIEQMGQKRLPPRKERKP